MNLFTLLPRQLAKLLLSMMIVAGVILFIGFLRTPSEVENQFLFGLSLRRVALGSIFAFILLLNVGAVFWLSLKSNEWRLTIESRFIIWLTRHVVLGMITLYVACLAISLLLLMVFHPFKKTFIFIEPIRALLGGPILWLFLLILLLLLFFRISYRNAIHENKVIAVVDHFLLVAAIFLITFLTYKHLLIWIGAANQKSYAYWNLLANEFLQGKLYLENPAQTHDLTFYQGKWYVPMPPFPAILMMPLAYLVGGENINTSDFSIVFSAINAVIIFLILEQLAKRRWITLSRVGMLLLVVLFAFGTPHLWVGIRGRAWFVSQIVTVTFVALSVFAALRSWSPWFVGISLGVAVVSRPNAIMTWPFVFAIAMQILKEEQGSVIWKQLLNWSIRSILPVVVAVGGLLIYNYARFENLFDFGYTTINGDPAIVENAQRYGIFSIHYILTNLRAMFFYVPTLDPGGQWPILPSTTGMSIFLVTPPFIYLFHHYEWKWWIVGAWVSIFLNFALLVLYHNTGADQFGYRYILDAIVPLMAMLAVSLSGKIPWLFVLLLLFSIGFNIYGAYWFING
jgi:hypothetical protein